MYLPTQRSPVRNTMSIRADIPLDSMVKLNHWENEKGRRMRDLKVGYVPAQGFTPNIWLTVARLVREHIYQMVR